MDTGNPSLVMSYLVVARADVPGARDNAVPRNAVGITDGPRFSRSSGVTGWAATYQSISVSNRVCNYVELKSIHGCI